MIFATFVDTRRFSSPVNSSDLEAELTGASGNPDDIRRAWATALALAWLSAYASDAEDEWRLLAAKGRAWLDLTIT